MTEHRLFISEQARIDVVVDAMPRFPRDLISLPFVGVALYAAALAQGIAILSARRQPAEWRATLMLI